MAALSSKLLAMVQDMVNEMDAALGDLAEGVGTRAEDLTPVRHGYLKGSKFVHPGEEKGSFVVGFSSRHAAVIHAGGKKGHKYTMHSGQAGFLRAAIAEALPDARFMLASRVQAVIPK